MGEPFGVYIHFPFCPQKCPYCDFAVAVWRDVPHERYADAVIAELRLRAAEFDAPSRRAVSIYFGGGTPSMWRADCFARVLRETRALFHAAADAEVTVEANPDECEPDRLRAFADAGATRLSLGVQSFEPKQLAALGRWHSAAQAERAFAAARAAGFRAVSVDLIHGGPDQTPAQAAADAARAAALGADHVSCYLLTLTNLAVDVPMARAVRRGVLELPGDEAQAEMGESLRAALGAAGLRRYEISNFARPGFESVHNRLYWTGAEYAAAGTGACGFRLDRSGPALRGFRTRDERSPLRYMDALEHGRLPEAEREEPAADALLRERLFTGLRMVDGVDLAELSRWSGLPARALHGDAIARLVREELASLEGDRLRLTDRGLDLHSEVAVRFF